MFRPRVMSNGISRLRVRMRFQVWACVRLMSKLGAWLRLG